MTPSAKARLRPLRQAATSAGLKWSVVEPWFPDWYEEALEHEAGLVELEGFVSRHLGVRPLPSGSFERSALPEACFKTMRGTSAEEVTTARGFVTAVARLVSSATTTPWQGLANEPNTIRQNALKLCSGGHWVDFAALLEASWVSGVPVLYLPQPPVTGRKMDGMVTFVAGHPVVVLCKKQDLAEWMVFILAHELGHIALGHLGGAEGEAIVDETVGDEDVTDTQEQEANRFASAILVPDGVPLKLEGAWPKAEKLAQDAIQFGRAHQVSPGHAVLSAARHTKGGNLYPLANKTLALIKAELKEDSTEALCRAAAQRHIDFDLLKADTFDYLEKLKVI